MKILQICKVCKAVNFNKSWHHASKVKLSMVKDHRIIWATRCPACKMAESRRFEGLVTIKHVPTRSAKELLRLIKEYTDRAYEKDCQDRLIEIIRQDPQTWLVTTTENQLAQKLAKKIGESFDHVETKINYSPEPHNAIKILVDFLPMFYHRFNFEQR